MGQWSVMFRQWTVILGYVVMGVQNLCLQLLLLLLNFVRNKVGRYLRELSTERRTTTFIYSVQNPNNSDLEDDDVDIQEDLDVPGGRPFARELDELSDSTDNDSKNDLPLTELAARQRRGRNRRSATPVSLP
ncbi:hypothetical protein FQR65_LT00829 [Abscondita terminalis]|nr:hypothetical protein FQR65_LT00829 [Abscondita terminalis]